MEETAWIAIGVISILIVIGSFINFTSIHAEQDRHRSLDSSMDSLSSMCNRVCGMPDGTYLSTRAVFPSEVVLEVEDARMCSYLEGSAYCRNCPCEFNEGVVLNLTGARDLFNTLDYQCFFLREDGELDMDCRA